MDSFMGSFSSSTILSNRDNEPVSAYSDFGFPDGFGFRDTSLDHLVAVDLPTTLDVQYPLIPNRMESVNRDSAEENDLSDSVLRNIHQILMGDHSDDDAFTIQDSTLDAAEKSLHEILHKGPSCSSSSSNLPSENQTSCRFSDRIEETINTLHSRNFESSDYECSGLTPSVAKEMVLTTSPNPEKQEGELLDSIPRRRKSLHREDSDLQEGRNKKHFTLCAEESVLHEMFDKALSLYDALPNEVSVKSRQKQEVKGSDDELAYSRKGIGKREAIDMRSLLMQCMQSVASNDHRSARNLLKQIRSRSSPLGDGSQRLAHYFANGLEARLAGYGNMEYTSLSSNMSDAGVLKAYKLYLSAFPFMETSIFFSNQMIMEVAKKATTLHIINFGGTVGFQWPCLIQHLSARPGGPPKLRITGIEFPQEGFWLASWVKETLANYCERFNVPFECKGVAQKWETICIEDLGIQKDEVIVVNCLYLSMFILDDLTTDLSPRDTVLNLIKRISPDIFIHGIVNGNYNSPFFISRFREALFHFSSLFDMLEANLSRENQERMVFERDIMGNAFLNVIACEGVGRIVRPETYKQWQIRTVRAGFKQLPLKQEITKEVKAKFKLSYNKGFFVKEDSEWMLTGWKGRVLFAFSCWKPASCSSLNLLN
ncbi:hypothetical protein Vadar_014173 [Vaccinium darrowii]|uniref:Uncharacterized protein n=1 Tax=Vaccinium darrowii TaxID=229202 RepID=A0ACB7ZB80_9ERIC|nr:hypothetical protein Vadar_014173 [Vaccinium darrowii]